MAFELRRIYRPVDGAEWKDIMLRRIRAALEADNTVNIARSFPLFKFKIVVELHPYHLAGDQAPVPDGVIAYQVDSEVFTPYEPAAVELVEQSPLYGTEADPQDLRRECGLGTIETVRTLTGELVDKRMRPTAPAVVVEPELPDLKPIGPAPASDETVEQTVAIEAQRWNQIHQPGDIEKAIAARDPALAPGRVSVIKSVQEGGGQDHGRRGRR